MYKLKTSLFDFTGVHYKKLLNNIMHFSDYFHDTTLVLDIGSGKSPYKKNFRYGEFITIDIDCASNPNILGDACNLPIRNGVVNLLLCIEVFEHIYEYDRILKEIYRVTDTYKNMILTVPLLYGVHDKDDYHRWTKRGITLLVTDYGFNIKLIKEIGGIFSTIAEMIHVIPNQVKYDGKLSATILYLLLFVLYILILLPLNKILIVFDRIDGRKNFTLGYCILTDNKMS